MNDTGELFSEISSKSYILESKEEWRYYRWITVYNKHMLGKC